MSKTIEHDKKHDARRIVSWMFWWLSDWIPELDRMDEHDATSTGIIFYVQVVVFLVVALVLSFIVHSTPDAGFILLAIIIFGLFLQCSIGNFKEEKLCEECEHKRLQNPNPAVTTNHHYNVCGVHRLPYRLTLNRIRERTLCEECVHKRLRNPKIAITTNRNFNVCGRHRRPYRLTLHRHINYRHQPWSICQLWSRQLSSRHQLSRLWSRHQL